MTAEISDERQQFLNNIANDTWVDDGVADDQFDELARQWDHKAREFAETAPDAIELCFFVEHYKLGQGA